LRLLIIGIDDDSDITSDPFADNFDDDFSCDRAGGVIEPNKNSKGEWNAVIMDLDLSKYPGAKGGEPFVRRSQPLRNGSTLMFEVRGHITVTRE
jgi:hypothetical protein